MLSHKLRLPVLPARALRRSRLDRLYADSLAAYGTLAVFASAGSGKTSQARLFAEIHSAPTVWLTLGEAGTTPASMVRVFAAAVEHHALAAPADIEEGLAGGTAAEELAASLADSVVSKPLLIVIDECEAVHRVEESSRLLGILLDYLPSTVRVIVQSRDELETAIGHLVLQGRAARVTNRELDLTLDETYDLFAQNYADPSGVETAFTETHGWMAGAVFASRQNLDQIDRARAFDSYMSREVLGRLSADEQQFLTQTAVLPEVTLQGATALLGPSAHSAWRSLTLRHLPATPTDGRALTYHPCFRRLLLEGLGRLPGTELERLYQKLGSFFERAGRYAESANAFIAAGDLDKALDVIQLAVPHALRLGDWSALQQWLSAVGERRVRSRPLLIAAELRALWGLREIDQARHLIRDLHSNDLLNDVVIADPGVLVAIASTLQWDPREALSLLRRYKGDFRAEGASFELRAITSDEALVPPRGIEWSEADRLVSWALVVQGRLEEVLSMLHHGEWPPKDPYVAPHPVLALVWKGDLAEARRLLEQVLPEERARNADTWGHIEAWLTLGEGDPAAGLAAASAAVACARRANSGWEPMLDIAVGRSMLALGRHVDGLAVLGEAITCFEKTGQRAYEEWGRTFHGLGLLLSDRANEAAATLRVAVEGMRRARRWLMLPQAAVYLAAALLELLDEVGADEMTEIAYEASEAIGSHFGLRQALDDVPIVLRRQMQLATTDERWRRVLAIRTQSVTCNRTSAAQRVIELQTMGPTPDIVIDGVAAGVRRWKVLELAALLAVHREGIDRSKLQLALFPEADRRRAGNYLRQVVHKLRQVTSVELDRDSDGRIGWPAELWIDTTDLRVERLVAASQRVFGADRLRRLEEALELATGPYLADSALEWIEARRFELDVTIGAAAQEACQLACDLGELFRARELAKRTLELDPYCDAAFRVLLKVEATIGTPSAAAGVFRRLCGALEDLGVAPDAATVELVRQMRVSRQLVVHEDELFVHLGHVDDPLLRPA